MILLPLFQLRSTSDLTGFPALREVPVGGLDVVPLLAAIAGDRGGWVYTLAG